ncbi:MAG: CopG family transcriptional regulator [Clostridia bacterium]|nr:CopG family transcriptional regulator [Clostridia bacterium]
MSKVPLQVYLDTSIHELLKLAAKKQKVSQSDLVRKYLYRGLMEDLEGQDPALDIIGMGAGKTPDLAERHDHYLARGEKETWEK